MLEYQLDTSAVTVADLQAAIEECWGLLEHDRHELASRLELPATQLNAPVSKFISISEEGAHFVAEATVVTIVLSAAAHLRKPSKQLWEHVVLPWLRREYGDQVLTEIENDPPVNLKTLPKRGDGKKKGSKKKSK